MSYQNVFKRYEMKYMLTRAQRDLLLQVMEPYMALDKFGHSSIRNIYFDTENYRLVRHSIERPAYKEKLRVRSYGVATAEGPVFVELKKKYQSVVYKRRVAMAEQQAVEWLCDRSPLPSQTQITQEIEYFLNYYQDLRPAVFLSYEREAFYCRDGGDFRMTFDENILCREEALSLEAGVWGTSLLPADKVLLELKSPGGIPLWLAHFLARQKIYKTSFSKYGTAYQTIILPNYEGGRLYA